MKRLILLILIILLIVGTGVNASSSKLHDWDTNDELQQWVDQHAMLYLIADDSGRVTFDGLSLNPLYGDCDDYARRMRNEAAEDGYYLSLQLVNNGWHMVNLAIIGNEMWLVDPMTTKITYIGNMD